MTETSSTVLTEEGTIDEGQGAVGVQVMEAFQAWAHLCRQADMSLDDVPCTMIIFNGGRTIHFWDFDERNIKL